MMNIFLVTGIIILQVLGYCFATYVLFDQKKWKFTLSLGVLVVSMVFYVLCAVNLDNMMFMTLVAILIFCTMLVGTCKQRINLAIKSIFVTVCLEEMLESIISLIIYLTSRALISVFELLIVAQTLLIVILIFIKFLKKCGWKLPKYCVSKLLNIALCILVIALLMVIGGIAYAEPYVKNETFSIMGSILSAVSYLGIAVLGVFVIYIKNTNDNYKILFELEERLRMSQQYHYEILLAREEETREFRHDISNHLICLKDIVEGGNLSVAKAYLNDMNGTISQIQKKHFSTGNDILDAIVNYYVQQLGEEVVLSVKGACIRRLEISDMELCSIISNLMENAIDALRNQQYGQKYLEIRMNSTGDVFQMKVSNSMEVPPILAANGLPMTSKGDATNHGIGLKHVQKVVEQVRGIFHIKIENKEFQVTLILPVTH